jgi:hypothetical protein
MSLGKSSPPPAPAQTASTVTQVPEYAPEQREYVADVFGKAQELYEQRTAEGFQPFPGAQIAPLQAQEEEAFAGIESLARGPGAAPAFEVARTASLGAAAPVTAGEIQGLMNPYQQAVTDIAKREAVRQYQRGPQQQMRTAAVGEGGLRGSRRFIEEAEGQRNLQQRLSDIQTMGGQQAFQQAMAEAAASRGRLANLAAQMPSIGTGAYQQQMAQLGQLGGVGEALRAREQSSLDLAQQQFQQELMFPEETLATYLRFITNAPSPSGFQRQTVSPVAPGPGTLQQLAGLGISGAAAGKAFGLFNRGGAVGRRAGLSGIVRRSGGGQIVRLQTGSYTDPAAIGRDDLTKDYFRSILAPGKPLPESGSGPLQDMARLYSDLLAAGKPEEARKVGEQAEGFTKVYGANLPRQGLSKTGIVLEGGDKDPFEESFGKGQRKIYDAGSLGVGIGLMPTGSQEIVGIQESEIAPRPRPEPKPKAEPTSVRDEVDDILGRLRRSGDVGDERLDDAAYLGIAAAALEGASAPGTVGRETGFVESLGKVLSPAAAAAATGMRETKKAQREEQAMELALNKEAREIMEATAKADYYRASAEEKRRIDAERIKEMVAIQKAIDTGELPAEQVKGLMDRLVMLARLGETTSTSQSGPLSERKPGSV